MHGNNAFRGLVVVNNGRHLMLQQLEVDYGNSKDFWNKPEKERYEYFKNCTIQYLSVLKLLETQEEIKEEAQSLVLKFANTMFFLIYIMTTDEEQGNAIEIKWLNRIKEEVENPIFTTMDKGGEA